MIGLADCGLGAWCTTSPMRVQTNAPDDMLDPDAFAILTTGNSMLPAGIPPGILCFCSPNTRIAAGDAVYVQRYDDTASIKIFQRRDEKFYYLLGYCSAPHNFAKVSLRSSKFFRSLGRASSTTPAPGSSPGVRCHNPGGGTETLRRASLKNICFAPELMVYVSIADLFGNFVVFQTLATFFGTFSRWTIWWATFCIKRFLENCRFFAFYCLVTITCRIYVQPCLAQ